MAEWNEVGNQLIKIFTFKSYLKNIAFVNAIAWQANKANHHPDLEVSFHQCIVKLTTHDNGGITEKDHALSKIIDQLYDE